MEQKTADSHGERGRIFGLNPNIVTAGLVSFFTDFSSQMVVPILPIFITTTLGAPIWVVGLTEGIGMAIAGVLRVFSGWISDRVGQRKALMVAGYGVSNLVKPLFALTTGWGQVLSIRVLDRMGKGTRAAPRDALLADLTTPADRGKSFGFRRAMDDLGAALGPLAVAWILLATHDNMRTVFSLTLIPGALGIAVLLTLKEKPNSSGRTKREFPRLGFRHLPGEYKMFTLISVLIALVNFTQAFLILRARSLGLSPVVIPVAYFSLNFVSSLFSMPAGMLSDRYGRKRVLGLGYLVLAGTYFGFALVSRTFWIWPLMAFYGIFSALTEGNQKVYVAELVSPRERGTALGTFNAVTGLAGLPGGILAGVLWQNWGPRVPFLMAAIVLVLAMGVFLLYSLSKR